jgi:kynurenine 3-monooxygenase
MDRFDLHQSFLPHGYKELTIPPADGGGYRLEPHAMHIWPRGGFMMMAMANQDGSFTVTLYLPFEGEHGFERLTTADAVEAFFRRFFPDSVALLPDLARAFARNPTGSLVTVRCAPWHAADRVVLLGDAAHAVVPFYGQGANASFEDCLVLSDCLAEVNRERALARFQALRKPHTDALAELAIVNFEEMRARVASPAFLLRKRFEHLLHRLLPRWYLPLYSMISFSRIPYAQARARAVRQWRIVLAGLTLLALALVLGLVRLAERA